jgi:pectate lyase
VIPASLIGYPAPPSQAATAPAGGGTYTIAASSSGRCIDVTAGSTVNGALLQQWSCHPEQAWQKFRVQAQANGQFNLVNVNSTRCVDVPNGAATAGVQIQQWGCGNGTKPAQLFTFTASGAETYQIRNVASGMCLSVAGSSTANGAAVTQESCAANANQRWAFNPLNGSGGAWPNTSDGFAATGGGTTGGAGGATVTVSTMADLQRYVTAAEPYVVRVSGTINVSPKGTMLRVASNKTVVGVGTSAHIVGGGFFVNVGVSNVIIRNLTIRDTLMPDDDPGDDAYDYDAIRLDTANRVWIDHNRLSRMNDGLLDSRKDTTNLTVSWNHFANNNKTFGIGWTANVTARITIHHNWFENTRTRNPSADNVANLHMYNNYLQNSSSYGNWVRGLTKAVIENSYYENVRNPYFVDAGELVQRGNITVNSPWDSGKVTSKGSAFNPSSFYPYTLDPAANVPNMLRTFAGPQGNIGV